MDQHARSIPDLVGIGLRGVHYAEMLERLPSIGWLEVHTENYFGSGGVPHYFLERLAEHYPISFHGVGLSLGSVDGISETHLQRTVELIEKYQPCRVSEHVSWSAVDGQFLNDLLPLPYTEEALLVTRDNICHAQDYLGRKILIENPSSYVGFSSSKMSEIEFIGRLVEESGCALLLDVNNVFVSCHNLDLDPCDYIERVDGQIVEEIHLAGHTRKEFEDGTILIDTHNALVDPGVWDLFTQTINRIGTKPTLIEWDTDLPALDTLIGEARKAGVLLEESAVVRAA